MISYIIYIIIIGLESFFAWKYFDTQPTLASFLIGLASASALFVLGTLIGSVDSLPQAVKDISTWVLYGLPVVLLILSFVWKHSWKFSGLLALGLLAGCMVTALFVFRFVNSSIRLFD